MIPVELTCHLSHNQVTQAIDLSYQRLCDRSATSEIAEETSQQPIRATDSLIHLLRPGQLSFLQINAVAAGCSETLVPGTGSR